MRGAVSGEQRERCFRRAKPPRPPRARRARVSRFVSATIFLVSVAGFPVSTRSDTLEYAVKAAYLYKFTPFVEWPASAFAGPGSPFNVCVLGDDPFGPALD